MSIDIAQEDLSRTFSRGDIFISSPLGWLSSARVGFSTTTTTVTPHLRLMQGQLYNDMRMQAG